MSFPEGVKRSPALLLGGIALLATLLLAGMHYATRDRIAAQQRQARIDALSVVMPTTLYDNDLLQDQITLRAPHWLGSDQALGAWRARRNGERAGLVLEAVAPDGYSGEIRLLVGVRADGRISGVRVIAHRETPGLGDAIEASRSGWIRGFDGRHLDQPSRERWRVRREGGEFDQFAGATVTPRAVVNAVRRVLDYVARHGVELYVATPETTLDHADAPDE